jgi:hypothetical protein
LTRRLGPFAASPHLARRHLSCAAVGACEAVLMGRLRMTLTFLMWLSQRDAWARQTLPPVLDGVSFTASVHPLT